MKDYKDYKKVVRLIKKATRSTFEIQSIKKLSTSYIVIVIQNHNKPTKFFVNLKENACMPI
jgi:hypothetical protein